MGMMETLFEKMDSLIQHLAENNKLRAAEGGTAAATPAKAGRKAAEKPAGPVHSEADLVAKFEEIKADVKNVPALKAIIAEVMGSPGATLPQLRQAPAKFDEAYEKLEALQASLGEATDPDDDL